MYDTNYRLRARFKDSSGDPATQWSAWGERLFRTASQPAPGGPVAWTVKQPGYQVEVFATGLELPVNIAFVPNPGPNANDAYFYVTELYGTIKVVSRDGTVTDYLRGALNYRPSGIFPGSGEQGLAGIVVDPISGDVFVSMLYDPEGDTDGPKYPKVVRYESHNNGKIANKSTTILDMVGENMYESHQISNLTFGPDGKLYVHMGDGFDPLTAQDLNLFRGKILRVNLNGSAPTDNPFYDASDGINAKDYVYAYGFRNAFGGDWRKADNFHYAVENGPSVDRFAKIVRGRNYLWDGTDASMYNYAIYNWSPAAAPVNIAFVQPETFGGSGFPADKMGHAFVSESGPTWAAGRIFAKVVSEFVLDASGNLVSGPAALVEYTGTGKATVAGLAAGPDGLYFTDLYVDQNFETAVARGANVLRIKYVGAAPATPTGLAATAGNAQVALTWTASSGATSYNVKRAAVSGGSYATIASGITTASYTDTTVTNATTYYYVVSAVNTFGESGNSAQVSATPSAVPPAGIAFRASATADNSSGATTITVSRPAGTASSDVMVATIYVRGAGSTAAVTPPTGWTLIRRDDFPTTAPSGNVGSLLTYYRVAGNSEPKGYTWTFDSVRRAIAGILGYSGVNTAAPIDASNGQGSPSNSTTSVIAPSLTTSTNNTMLVGVFALFEGGQSFTPPTGMIERIDATHLNANLTLELTDQTHATTGATGTRTATSSFVDSNIGQLIALKPAP